MIIDKLLAQKLDLMIDRMGNKRKSDNLLLVEGDEGLGKTNMAVIVGDHISKITGRSFSNKNIFFDADKMFEFAKSTEKQIIVWDEPALSGLSTDWHNKTQKNLIKLLMMVRKKRHFMIFCFTKFFKFNEYIVVDRAIGMIHMYSSDGLNVGRWAYFKNQSKEALYNYWRTTRRRAYKKFYDFRGKVSWKLPKIIDEKAYEKEKDKAILSIGGDKSETLDNRENKLFFVKKFVKVWIEKQIKIKGKDLSELFEIHNNTISNYKSQIMTKNT
ncbi:hypothetical protein LCGC14_2479340 [marine sediment metagenome]|uniref:Uncharacterized protein n=1 Tax=marine sediment metagenome TaxID=412755 RepID=A0A0F9DK39_9ZZZZ